ncbi:hypothetical protein C4D60_Mb06t04800 [Musa balbisiana]|uniref:Uncharacterized protein n=1 Tax=Musa balbisiana TaxID=52838 RepID=A0A4V4H3P0_MUSBA|nr:hypothetical protein C4D60_Mb06t04800 [Musa balbisiana]
MVIYESSVESIELKKDILKPGLRSSDHVHPPEHGEVVCYEEGGKDCLTLFGGAVETVVAAIAKGGPASDTGSKREQLLTQVDDDRVGSTRTDRFHGSLDLVLSHGSKGRDLLGGEELRHANLPQIPPMASVRGEGHVGAAEGEFRGGDGARPAAALEVVGSEDLLGRPRGRDDHDGDMAKLQAHDRAVLLGEFPQGLVQEAAAQLVERKLHRCHANVLSRTNPSPFPKWYELEVLPIRVYRAPHESLRLERLRPLP